jgi:hypothetical protein
MRTAVTALLLCTLSLAGCTLRSPRYSSRVDAVGDSKLVVHVSSDSGLSSDALRRALLTEAAHAAIERGAIYLAIEEITTDGSIQRRETQSTRPGTTSPEIDPQSPGSTPSAPSVEPAIRSDISFVRVRNGSIRFSIARERPDGVNVFDASRLLDTLGRDEMPAITETHVIVQ